jgi:hypothetical protein
MANHKKHKLPGITNYDGDRWLLKVSVANRMKRMARHGVFDGSPRTQAYLNYCRGYHVPSGTLIVFTRDTGMHTSGFFKNPDFERCFHLSLSFFAPETGENADQDHGLAREWCESFFGDNYKLLWVESPYTDQGKSSDTWHYRLLMHDDWHTPLLPRGEVYSKNNTEAGWKSWSDAQDEIRARRERITEILGNEIER